MERGTDYDVSAEDHQAYVDGENAEAAKPIAAEIVGPVTVREFPAKSWSGQSVVVDTNVQQLASRIAQRTRLLIVNNGANSVYLSSTREACSVTSGFELVPGPLGITMQHSGEVFAVAEDALPADLSIMAEFRDGGS